jgi:cytochrome c-type biogenesis protein CcmH
MSRPLRIVALGAAVALGALAVVVAVRPGAPPTLAERADALAAELRCPDCQGLSVADSPTAAAAEIRRQVEAMLADGAGDDEVRAHFTARYGEWILLAPTSPLVWALPFVAVIAGLAGLAAWVASRREPLPPTMTLDDGERRRLHDEAEALDA